MLNEQRLEKLRSDIKRSTLLTDAEKTDWLQLLELMNDKQVADLEEILRSQNQASSGSPAVGAGPVKAAIQAPLKPAMPTLSHISNLPAHISYEKPEHLTTAGKSGQISIKPPLPKKTKSFQQILEEATHRPPAANANSMGTGSAASSLPKIPPVSQISPAPVPADQPKPAPVKTQPAGPSKEPVIDEEPVVRPEAKKSPISLRNLESLAALDLTVLRASDTTQIFNEFHNLVKQYGYFAVVQNFEASKLYKSYLTRGKNDLAGISSEGKYTVDKEEFELIADILQSIRMNRT